MGIFLFVETVDFVGQAVVHSWILHRQACNPVGVDFFNLTDSGGTNGSGL